MSSHLIRYQHDSKAKPVVKPVSEFHLTKSGLPQYRVRKDDKSENPQSVRMEDLAYLSPFNEALCQVDSRIGGYAERWNDLGECVEVHPSYHVPGPAPVAA